jgi:uncharacterized delta-60 repeat protein
LNQDGGVDASSDVRFEDPAEVKCLGVQADEKIIIAGNFTLVNGTRRSRVARLYVDGTIDETFTPGDGANDTVHSMSLQPDGKVLLGGMFTSFDGVSRNDIARLDANGRLDASFNPGAGPNRGYYYYPAFTHPLSPIHSMISLPDGRILACGYFTNFSGFSRNGLVRLFPDGSVDQAFDSRFGYTNMWNLFVDIDSAVALPDGNVAVGASFYHFGSNSNGGIQMYRAALPALFRLDADGSVDTSFSPVKLTADGARWFSLGLQADGRIVGAAELWRGERRIYRLEANASVDPGFETNAFPELTYSMGQLVVQRNDKILVAGSGIRRLNPDGTSDDSFASVDVGPSEFVQNIALNKDQTWLVCAGLFESLNGNVRPRLARIFTAQPRLFTPYWSPSKNFAFQLVGEPGWRHRIGFSSDLLQWVPVQTVILSNSQQVIVPTANSNSTHGFYRAVLLP